MTGKDQKAAIKSRYAIIGGLWVLAVAVIFSLSNPPRLSQQPLDDGVIILLTFAITICLLILIAVLAKHRYPSLARSLIWTCIIAVSVYGFLGLLSIGGFILPAALILYFAVYENKKAY